MNNCREISGRGLAVCDHIDFVVCSQDIYWPFGVLMSPPGIRGTIRYIDEISESVSHTIRLALFGI